MDTNEENNECDPTNNDTDQGTDVTNEMENVGWDANDLKYQQSSSDESEGEEEASDYSSTDSDGLSEKCPICLTRFTGQEIGTPETCEHYFCLDCITKWSNKTATCPVDRKSFPSILVRQDLEGKVVRVQEVVFANQEQNPDGEQYDFNQTYCEVCGLCDREDRLLLCDGCDLGYHLECLEPRLEYVPIEDWFCPRCQASYRAPEAAPISSREASHRSVRVARTSQSIRILHSIARSATSEVIMETAGMNDMRRSAASSRNSSRDTQANTRKRIKIPRKRKTKSKRTSKRKGRASGRTASAKRPSSIRRRLLQQLRIVPPRPGQVYVGLPNCRTSSSSVGTSASSSTSSLSSQRYNAGITPLRLYDSYHDLESYNNSGDEGTGGEVSVAAQIHHRIGLPMRSKFGRSSVDITPASLSGSVDILGPILNRQFILHHDRNIHITRDGTLVPSMSTNVTNMIIQNSSIVKKSDRCENNNNNNESSFNTQYNNNVVPIKLGQNSHSNSVSGPLDNEHRTLPTSGMNGYARQAPISPNGTSSAANAPSSFSNSESNNTETSGQYVPPVIDLNDGGSNSLVNRGSLFPSHNDNELFPGNNLSQVCKSSTVGTDKPKSDDETNPKLNSKRSQNSRKSTDSHSKQNNDSDDDYNIYSDIEEVPEVVVKDKKAWRKPSQDQESEKEPNRDREKDSDSEMVIDENEENPKIRRNSVDPESTSRTNINLSDARALEVSVNAGANVMLEDPVPEEIDPIEEYGIPSPESIPLPDSPPPVNMEGRSEDSLTGESFIPLRNDILDVRKEKSARREEYDPSQPLDSSDEEEHSMKLTKQNDLSVDVDEEVEMEREEIEILSLPTPTVPPTNSIKESEDDLTMIPMPPHDDYRRPTIQFSIPTRHRLLPISSLIKRQKGVMRKENKNGNPMSFQSEISKIFGDEKGEEGGPGDWNKLGESVDDLGKISLVAEIFGSDDEEGESDSFGVGLGNRNASVGNIDVIGNAEIEQITSKLEQPGEPEKIGEITPTATSTPIASVANSRWKTIAEPIIVPDPLINPQNTQNAVIDPQKTTTQIEDDENSEEANEIEVVAVKEAEVVVLSEVTKSKSRELHLQHSDSKANSEKMKDLSADEVYTNKSNSSLESISDEDSFDSDSSAVKGGNGVSHKSRRKRDATGTKSRKRARSHSPSSNCEEGEIVDAPEKKKKKGKKKKSKKRKKSKDSRSPSVIEFSEKRVPDAHIRHSSSEELDHENKAVSWRKPSKSNKQRNYRDGKPKAEEKYFRENDKHRDPSPRDRERRERDKHGKDKSPIREVGNHSSEKTESRRSPDASKNHSSRNSKGYRYGSDRRSRSRSVSKSRKDKHHDTSTSRRLYSTRSESRNSPTRYSRRHNRRSKSPGRLGHSRSLSRNSGKLRSHSPTVAKSRRRSRSDSRSRRSRRRRSLSTSSSHSVSSKKGKGKSARKDRSVVDDRQKRKNKDKEKDKEREREREKVKEKDKDKEKDKEKVEVRETKDKKKKRKRREKSVSPVKAIVADGDSIVVSLNFQKGKDSSSSNTNADQPNQNKNEDTSKRKGSKSKSNRSEDKHSGKPKLLKKTVLIDLEASPIQEQHIGVSPTVIVLSDDDEADPKSKEQITNNKHNEDKNSGVVGTNSSVGTGVETGESCSPYLHCQGVAADSTQVQPQSGGKPGDVFNASLSNSGSPDEGSNGSLMREESVVTSTRGSVETTLPNEVESSINSCSPTSKAVKGKMSSIFHTMSPSATTSVPLGSSPTYMNRNENVSTPSTAAVTHKQNGQPAPMAPTSVGSILGKPVIGNIPGLFPSNTGTMAGGNVSIPSPIVIPTPPAPQLRFPAMNPSLLNSNMLVSVASAIYGPLLAARQQSSVVRNLQPTQMAVNTLGNVIANKNNLQGSVLLPKNQNFHTFNNNRSNNVSIQPAGDGDSPFSPNSSEGDDLFEPPNDRGQLDSVSSSSKADKNSSSTSSAPGVGSAHAQVGSNVSTSGGKAKSTLFDSLFGASPNKGVQHNKMQERISKIKSGSHQKSKSHRQTVKKEVKLSEGELRLSEDVPTSAVELRVKEKFLKKLNRQERVVEEVKLSLKPHYSKKHITKDEYKEILRKAVPKICHNKSGEINPNKIKELVEAYVKKFRHARKRD